jgi:hypothetical protein
MRSFTIIAALLSLLVSSQLMAQNIHNHGAKHGGVVLMFGDKYHAELLRLHDSIDVYISNVNREDIKPENFPKLDGMVVSKDKEQVLKSTQKTGSPIVSFALPKGDIDGAGFKLKIVSGKGESNALTQALPMAKIPRADR